MPQPRSDEARIEQPFHFSLRSLFVVMTSAALLLFSLVWLWNNISFGIFPTVEPKPFDEKQWKSWSIEDMRTEDIRRAYVRRDMLDDLLKRHSFTGWKTTELVSLLGPSNPEFCPNDWDVAYLLGIDWVDYVVLVFSVDENGRVKSHHVLMF